MDDEAQERWHLAPHELGGGLLYTLEETGRFKKGEPEMRNRHMITVHRYGSVSKEQADNLAGRLLSILNGGNDA